MNMFIQNEPTTTRPPPSMCFYYKPVKCSCHCGFILDKHIHSQIQYILVPRPYILWFDEMWSPRPYGSTYHLPGIQEQ